MPAVQQGFSNLVNAAKTAKYRQVTVKEATLNTLVAVEIVCWFFVGEVIGKRSLIGYNVDGGFHLGDEI